MNLSNLCMVKLERGIFNPTVTDRKETKETATRTGANEDYIRTVKRLVPKELIKECVAVYGRVYGWFNDHSAPFVGDSGRRIWKVQAFTEVGKQHLDKEADEYAALADAFCLRWHEVLQAAGAELVGMFSESDYPSVDRVRERFYIRYKMSALPNLHGVSGLGQYEQEFVEAIKAEQREAVEESVKAPLRKAIELLRHASATLGDPEKIFRNSLVENLKELAQSESFINIADNDVLSRALKDIKTNIASYNPDDLRNNTKLRSEAGQAAQALADQFTTVVNRRIVVD